MRLLVTLLGASGNGPVTGTAEVVRMCAEAGQVHGADVAVALPPNDSLAEAIAPHASVRFIAPASARRDLGRNAIPILKLVHEFRPDVIHFHVPSAQWGLDAVAAGGITRSTRVIRTEHNPLMSAPRRSIRAALRIADHNVDEFVYVSVGNRRRYESHLPWRRHGVVVNNTIDPRRLGSLTDVTEEIKSQANLQGNDLMAVFVAGEWQLTSNDGRRPIAPVIEALGRLNNKRWKLVVVGNGPVDRASALAHSLGVGSRVAFLGARPDAAAVIAAADVLVSASHYEGCSVAFLEAWYLGVPVLTTDVDGVEDVIGADQLGAVVVPQNDPEGFAHAWEQLTDAHSPIRRANAEATRAVRTSFTSETFSKRMWEIYTATKHSRA